jgi:hypothetical protein
MLRLAARVVEVFVDDRHLDPARSRPRSSLLALHVRRDGTLSRATRNALTRTY